MAEDLTEDKNHGQMYERIVSSNQRKQGVIICPECGQELLITPMLSGMNQVIENHIELHKTINQNDSFTEVAKLLSIRLSLMWQVLNRRGIYRLS
jgi:hypothetical protein